MTDRLNEETDSRRKMADKLSHERHTSQKEKETTQEVVLKGHMTSGRVFTPASQYVSPSLCL